MLISLNALLMHIKDKGYIVNSIYKVCNIYRYSCDAVYTETTMHSIQNIYLDNT